MNCRENSPIAGKHLVLVGTLLGLDRQDSTAFLSQLGATVQSDINLQTQYIIQGTLSESELGEHGTGAVAGMAQALAGISNRRQQDINKRSEQGQALTILSQRQLLAMLPSGLDTASGQGW
jgi:hypothetical protein